MDNANQYEKLKEIKENMLTNTNNIASIRISLGKVLSYIINANENNKKLYQEYISVAKEYEKLIKKDMTNDNQK